MTIKQRLSRLAIAAVRIGKVSGSLMVLAALLWLLAQVARNPAQLLVLVGFLMLVGVWLILYAALVVSAQCDDEEGKR